MAAQANRQVITLALFRGQLFFHFKLGGLVPISLSLVKEQNP